MPDATPIASATELTVRYGPHTVLERATIAVNERDRIGLVGRNGCGKSTFLRIAAGELQPDSGAFTRKRELVTGYLPQAFSLREDATVLENIRAGAAPVLALIHEYENTPPESTRAAELLEHIQHLDGWMLDQRVEVLATHLDAPARDRIVGTLSGGEKRRVALCRALLARPDFLILDEPTNHLDTDSIEWLEDFLSRYPGACLFVTHDRYFLDRIATRIIELAGGTFRSHEGNYSDFLVAKAERAATDEEVERKRQRFLKKELEWVRRGPSARRTKSVDRIERYHDEAAREGPEQELDVELVIPPAPKLANRVIELRQAGMEVDDRILFDRLSLNLLAGQKLGIVGRNGVGKTTLLRVMLGQLPPTWGEVEIGARTVINYVDQNRLALDDSKTVWDEVGEGLEYVRLGDENLSLRGYLRRFLFTEERINTKIGQLSGGERSRVTLAKILKRGGNVIVLDEPTNDLDLATLRMLEEALLFFQGTVIVVSHDRWFLNRVCTHTLSFDPGGVVSLYAGNYDYYLEKRAQPSALIEAAPPPKPAAPPPPKEKARKLTYKETKELEGIEATILAAEEEVAKIEAAFADPGFFSQYGSQIQAMDARLEAKRDEIPRLYARWEELARIKAGDA
jgi:ATP-binding cassette subfamily F protein uup